jgi:hypothetical protein
MPRKLPDVMRRGGEGRELPRVTGQRRWTQNGPFSGPILLKKYIFDLNIHEISISIARTVVPDMQS